MLERFDEFDVDYDDYILCMPSGEVIDMKHSDVLQMKRLDYANWNEELRCFTSDDLRETIIKKYVDSKKDVGIFYVEKFLKDCGLLEDQFIIYSMSHNFYVDVYAAINISYKSLFKIPFKFRRCYSDFNCSFSRLLTLENAPDVIHGKFDCSNNFLTTLDWGPKTVIGSYKCEKNKLVTLRGAPEKIKNFNCSDNNLKNLRYKPEIIEGGRFISNNNPLEK